MLLNCIWMLSMLLYFLIAFFACGIFALFRSQFILQTLEELIDGTRPHPEIWSLPTLHGEGFACPCLPIRKDRCIVTLNNCLDTWTDCRWVNLFLRTFRSKTVVESIGSDSLWHLTIRVNHDGLVLKRNKNLAVSVIHSHAIVECSVCF